MAAKYAAAIAHNGATGFSLAVAVKNSANATAPADSGGTSIRSPGEVAEARATLLAAGYATQVTQYPSTLLTHAQADALALAGTL